MARERKARRERRMRRGGDPKAVTRVTLFPDEAVVMAAIPAGVSTLPKSVATLGMYEFWRRRHTAIVTDRRLLFGRGIVRRTEQSIPLSKVTDVVFTRRGLNCYAEVAVNDRGRNSIKRIGPMSGTTARQLVGEILRRT